jgi:hypothetical protein
VSLFSVCLQLTIWSLILRVQCPLRFCRVSPPSSSCICHVFQTQLWSSSHMSPIFEKKVSLSILVLGSPSKYFMLCHFHNMLGALLSRLHLKCVQELICYLEVPRSYSQNMLCIGCCVVSPSQGRSRLISSVLLSACILSLPDPRYLPSAS